MVIWVCEASEVNNLTALAVGPNGHNKDVLRRLYRFFYGGYTQETPIQGRYPSGPTTISLRFPAQKNCPKLGFRLKTLARGGQGHISIALSKYDDDVYWQSPSW